MFKFGDRLRQLRKDSHYSQAELGEKIGVSGQVISNWERGYSECNDVEAIIKLAQIFNVPVEGLIGFGKFDPGDDDYSRFVYDNSFPEKLKALLKEKQMDTYMLADKTGISESRLDEYIYQRRQPIAVDLIKISGFFDVSIDWLLDTSRRKNLSEDEENLLLYYSLMSDECKKLLTSEAYLLYVKGISGVAAPEYGRYFDSEKKSHPSNGTGGSEAV